MKKFLSLLLVCVLAFGMLASCGNNPQPNVSPNATPDTAPTNSDAPNSDYSNLKIALVTDPIGNEQFILQAYNKFVEYADTYDFKWTNVECVDTAAWEENSRALAQDGYDLVIAVGWQAASPFSALADEFPETDFAVIDTLASNEKVKSINFNTVEGCYVLGSMIATAFPDETLFGYVCNFQDQASYEYRYGFMEGIKRINPDAEFMFNYANSYSDTSIVYELAMQQAAAGCTFVFGGVANSANAGIYQAALELANKGTPIYSTGLSVDQTTQDNPYIIGGVTKQTDICTALILDEYLAGNFTGGKTTLGIRESAFGVVGITTDGFNYRNEEIITDDVLAAGQAALDDLQSGAVVLAVPQEAGQ